MNTIGERPAFPVPPSDLTGSYEPDPGMTYRQWLAGQFAVVCAGQGASMIADLDSRYDGHSNWKEVVALNAVEFADALIAELSKPHASLDH